MAYRSLIYSIILHAAILVLAVYGLPKFSKEQTIHNIITVDISNISDITKLKRGAPQQPEIVKKAESIPQPKIQAEVIKPKEVEPKNVKDVISSDKDKKVASSAPSPQAAAVPPKVEQQKVTQKQAEIQNKPVIKDNVKPQVEDKTPNDDDAINLNDKKNKKIKPNEKLEKKEQPKPTIADSQQNPKIKKEVEPNKQKKVEPKQSPVNNKQKSIYSDAILKSLESPSSANKQQPSAQSALDKIIDNAMENSENTAELHDIDELSLSEKDAIVSQISKAWNMSAFTGNKNRGEMRVRVLATLDPDGNVLNAKPQIDSSQIGDPSYVAFVNSAVRAFYAASPLQGLLDKNYELWKEIDLGFDASGIIN